MSGRCTSGTMTSTVTTGAKADVPFVGDSPLDCAFAQRTELESGPHTLWERLQPRRIQRGVGIGCASVRG